MAGNLTKEGKKEMGEISTLGELKAFLEEIPDDEIIKISIETTKKELEKGVKELDGRAESESGV